MIVHKQARREPMVAICGALLAAGLASGFINLACASIPAHQGFKYEPTPTSSPSKEVPQVVSVDVDQVAAQAAAIVKLDLDAKIETAVSLKVQSEMNGLKITTTQQIPTSWVITAGATIIVWQWLNHLSRMRAAKARK